MEKKFFIIIGRSGSGKGTQSTFLVDFLKLQGLSDIKHVTTGGGFRNFQNGDTFSAKKSNEVTGEGGLGPEFLAIWNWSNIFIQEVSENTTVILDGAPRRLIEVEALHSAISFYGYHKVCVIYLDVTETWAVEKLSSRGREDDANAEERERKMKWFFEHVLPCVAFYKNNPLYEFIHVNGEQTIQEVSKELEEKLSECLEKK
jgi:adenylate kinase family enzyme